MKKLTGPLPHSAIQETVFELFLIDGQTTAPVHNQWFYSYFLMTSIGDQLRGQTNHLPQTPSPRGGPAREVQFFRVLGRSGCLPAAGHIHTMLESLRGISVFNPAPPGMVIHYDLNRVKVGRVQTNTLKHDRVR